MKKLLLVFISLAIVVFIHQNVELDFLNSKMKYNLLKEINIINQLQQYKELLNNENQLTANQEPIDQYQHQNPNLTTEKTNQLKQTEVASLIENEQVQQVSPDILAMVQSVNLEDQMKVANVLLKRFSIAELNEYRTMAMSGIDEDKKEQLKKSILSRLTEEDITTLKEIAENYLEKYAPDREVPLNNLANKP